MHSADPLAALYMFLWHKAFVRFTIIDGVEGMEETVDQWNPVESQIAMPDLTLWQSTACVQTYGHCLL